MGQKVNPNGLRLGINRDWSSHWYAKKSEFASVLDEDIKIRAYLNKELAKIDSGLSRIDIERVSKTLTVSLLVSHPAIVLGQDGANVKLYKKNLVKLLKKDANDVKIAIVEIKNPDLDAMLVAKDISKQLQERASYRVVQKKAIQRVMRAGAKGCKTMTKGRIGGAEIARYEEYREGILSLHTLRQPLDYAYTPCHTTYGVIGVKVWIALPDNYEELRSRRPDDGRNNRGGRFNNRGGRFNNNHRAPRNATAPAAPKDGEAKGE